MPATAPTFVFDDDGKAYAYVAGKIVAAAEDVDELERKLADFPADFKKKEDPEDDRDNKDDEDEEDDAPVTVSSATHVVTPNGLKGTILGKQRGLWGDQVTIRLENGRIAKFDVTSDSKMEYIKEAKTVQASPIKALQDRLDEMPDGTKDSLVARIVELKAIKREAANLIRSSSYSDGETLDNLVVQADYEVREVTDALAGLEDAESFIPEAPFAPAAVEQASMGGNDGSWLDNAAEEMIAENEAQDFDALISEAPDTFVAELETPVLEDAGVTREYADQFVSARTAGLEKTATTDFRAAFLQRVEEARQFELRTRQADREVMAKEASAENHDGEAEGLFW
ncbi:MAG: zinc ribbon protein [Ferruginibacter sp.]|uniref:hypothetical protein n=1 Tax=Ferruginibacter sp. TaxID=1940288 RepID=UPI00265A00B5|nr:hypothetical protein [Ferruginibacter sp.]MDB5280904.1 zinc ribbon protein [Ferruginibacter sp.]